MKNDFNIIVAFALLLVFLLLTGCSQGVDDNSTLNVSAAISMKDSLIKIKKLFEKENPGVTVSLNFASSGALQQQIEQGAPVDVFISAGNKQMNDLEKKNLVKLPREIAGNELVLIVPFEAGANVSNLQQLTGSSVEKIAMGNPDTVPAGRYTEEALKNAGVLREVEPKTVLAKDVRQVLTYVETGEVDAGFVYKTDYATSKKVRLAQVVSARLHSPIVYPAALVGVSPNKNHAEQFLDFLCSKEAKAVFKDSGFTVPK